MAVSPPIPSVLWRDPLCVAALGFGAGALPKVPGTWGTLAAVPFFLALQALTWAVYAAVVAVAFVVGVVLCGRAARRMGVQDHPAIVWDEMVGFWVAMAAAPTGWGWLAAGFVLFRLFDIWKPWPIRWLDRHVAGGLGIMIDDLAAGLCAALSLYLGEVLMTA